MTKGFQVSLFKNSKLEVVLPEYTRGTITSDKPDAFDHYSDSQTPVQFDVKGSDVIWTWTFVLRPLSPLEELSEV